MAFNLGGLSGALDDSKLPSGDVDFAGRSLKLDNANDAKPIVDAINLCSSLRSLDLTGNTLGVAAAQAIAHALALKPEFECARWSDMFTGRMKTEIPPALSALGEGMIKAGARLTVLELSDNAFGPIGVEGLAALLKSDVCSKLEELRLNNNGLGITGGKLLAKALLGTAPPRLKVFIAGRNRLENDGAKALAEVFQKMGSLEEIAMPQNGIYHVGISALCEAFQHNPNLCTLNLNDNTIGPKGAVAFAKVLPKLKQLRAINFGDCLLKSAGALALAEAFQNNDILLEVLDVSHNEIGSAACAKLADAISRHPDSLERLERVVLAGNRLGGAVEKKYLRAKLGTNAALSDGEGDSDEEQDDEESETESDGDTESETEENENSKRESQGEVLLDNSGVVEEITTDVAKFFKNPSLENFNSLGTTAAEQIDARLQAIKDPEQLSTAYAEAIALVSGLSLVSNEARTVAKELYAHAIKRLGARHAPIWILTNALLVHLGLIKSESRSFTVRWDLTGCYSVLADVIEQPFLPDSLKETIKFFAKTKREKDPNSTVAKFHKLCG